MSNQALTLGQLRSTRKAAIGVDLSAVTASLGFNLAAAPASVAGWLIGAVAPLGLFLAIALWHRADGVLTGWIGRLFSTGLAAVAAMAGYLSFGHIRKVAVDLGGMSSTEGAVLALVVDALAVLAALVVVGAGKAIAESEAAEATAERERLEAERAATAERERLEAERVANERKTAEAKAKAAERLDAAKASSPTATETAAQSSTPATRKLSTDELISAALAVDHGATAESIGASIGKTKRTVQRSDVWRNRHQLAA